MKIDSSTIEQARNTDIIAFFEKYHGFTFAHQGGAYRCKQHPSLVVKDERRSFYWHSKGVGGFGVLDYLTKVENMTFRDAIGVVMGTTPITTPARQQPQAEPPKILVLPEKTGVPLKLYDYLCKRRGVDSDIVNRLMQKGMIYEDRRGNVVFVGYDAHRKPRFASLRGTHGATAFRGDCAGSDKRYGFAVAAGAPSQRLYIFESAIDLMSHASLEKAGTGAWEQHSRLSLAGTSDTAIPFFLNQHRAVTELVFCLDNDAAGRDAAVFLARKYAAMGYHTRLELPQGKDWNEDLQTHERQIQAERRAIYRHRDVSI